MNNKKGLIVLMTLALVLVVLNLPVFAGFEDYVGDPKPPKPFKLLEGLKGVHVVVERLNPDVERDGLITTEKIQTDVELKLRMAGIKVLTREESLKTPGCPWLYISIPIFKSELGFYAYSINVDLVERVFLQRNLDLRTITFRAMFLTKNPFEGLGAKEREEVDFEALYLSEKKKIEDSFLLYNEMVSTSTFPFRLGVAMAGEKIWLVAVREHVKDLVDKFINAYLAANPK